MTVFVTGPDGLLGSNLVRDLLLEGHHVRAFIHPKSRSRTLDGLPIERIYGDITDLESVRSAMAGCPVAIHAAANTSIWPTRSKKIWEVNFDGTRNVVEAALACQTKRLIYVSSASVFPLGTKEAPGDETAAQAGDDFGLDYIESKIRAQEMVLKAVREQGLPAVLINPTFMFGEYDSMPSSGQMIVAFYQRKLPGYTSGGKNFVYVKDVSRAIVHAITLGRIGECYIAGGTNLHYRELFEKMGQVLQVPPPRLGLPDAAVLLFGYLGTWIARLRGKAPTLSPETARVATQCQFYSQAKAVQELQMPQTDIETAIDAAFQWLNANGYC